MTLMVLAFPASARESDPAAFVVALNQDVATQLGARAIDAAERRRRLTMLIDSSLDFMAVGEGVLGWRWAKASAADREGFVCAFRTYLVQTFAAKILGDGQMIVVSSRPDGDTILVATQFLIDGTRGKLIIWRVIATAAGWRLCDIMTQQVSLAALMRSQFDAVLPAGRPDIRPLIRLLHEKAEK